MVRPQAELGEQGPGVGDREARRRHEHVEQRRALGVEQPTGLVDLADHHAGAEVPHALVEREPAEQRADERGLAAAVVADDGDALGPADRQRDRAEREPATPHDGPVESGDHRAGARRGGDLELELPALPRFVDDLQPLDRPLRPARPPGQLLGGLGLRLAQRLVVVGLLALGPRHALGHPLALALGPRLQGVARVGVVAVRRLGPLAGEHTLVLVGLPATGIQGGGALVLVELDDVGDGAFEEGAVVAHEHDGARQRAHEPFETIERGQVEIVRRLVEQQHVVAREQECGELHARRLASRERRQLLVEQTQRKAEFVERGVEPGVEVGPAEAQPAVEGVAVQVGGAVVARRQRGGGRLHRLGRLGDSGAPPDELRHGLTGATLGLLVQVADRGAGRGGDHRALVRSQVAGEHAQERGLADAVRADEPDAVARRRQQIDGVEDG